MDAFRVGSFEDDGQPDLHCTSPFEVFPALLSLTVDSKCSTVIGREPVGFQASYISFCLVI